MLNETAVNDEEMKKQFLVQFYDGVYDLTKFLEKHPGGVNTLKGLNGNDMTRRFLNAPPHSNAAIYLMKEYKVKNRSKLTPDIISHDEIVTSNEVDRQLDDHSLTKVQNTKSTQGGPEQHNFMAGEDLVNNNNIDQLIDESMEHLVDWSSAMLPQIPKIKEQYDEWVNKPVDRPLRLFNPWYLEICTKTPWWLVPLFWIPVVVFLVCTEAANKNFLSLIVYFTYGVIIWTFVEYSLHRWVFHMKSRNQYTWLCVFHFMLHGLHHKVPFDPYRLVFPPVPAAILATIFYPLVKLLSENPRITMAGGLFGYICYDMMHYYLHYGNPKLWHMYQMKRYHYQHHFAHHDLGFGISSPIWDFIFGTRIYLRKLKYILQWKL